MEKLLAEGVDVSDVMSLPGYAGPMNEGDPVRLFPSLQDLSVYVEIPADEILHVEKAAETTLPNDGVIVWLRNDSAVIFKRTRTVHTAARLVRHMFGGPGGRTESSARAGAPLVTQPQLVESRHGRLRIMARDSTMAADCRSLCFVDPPCQSTCRVCQSRGCM
ncbi:hypothetical protein OG762_49250 (plasmid) [Streptomyces sp. NBC_01136]|uniref:hypothetical protein n=1 Tax=unclassified Streptomyces TaxID=2593676 RepID=UPI003246E5A8|nr:hypothetical protein OG762_49250 [Streptomyces sp. NBC_01136]